MHGVYIGAYLGKEKICPICEKEFYTCTEEWAFKRKLKENGNPIYMCSWKCVRKWDAEHERKKPGRQRCQQVDEIYRLLELGEFPAAIAKATGVSVSTVHYYRDRWKNGGDKNG